MLGNLSNVQNLPLWYWETETERERILSRFFCYSSKTLPFSKIIDNGFKLTSINSFRILGFESLGLAVPTHYEFIKIVCFTPCKRSQNMLTNLPFIMSGSDSLCKKNIQLYLKIMSPIPSYFVPVNICKSRLSNFLS